MVQEQHCQQSSRGYCATGTRRVPLAPACRRGAGHWRPGRRRCAAGWLSWRSAPANQQRHASGCCQASQCVALAGSGAACVPPGSRTSYASTGANLVLRPKRSDTVRSRNSSAGSRRLQQRRCSTSRAVCCAARSPLSTPCGDGSRQLVAGAAPISGGLRFGSFVLGRERCQHAPSCSTASCNMRSRLAITGRESAPWQLAAQLLGCLASGAAQHQCIYLQTRLPANLDSSQ